jgi:hypothetical protein
MNETTDKHRPFDPSLFKLEAISPETLAANEAFRKAMSGRPNWWDMGVPAYRARLGGVNAIRRTKARAVAVDDVSAACEAPDLTIAPKHALK